MIGTMISIFIVVVILGYAAYTIYNNIKLQSKGKCVGCSKDCGTCNIAEEYIKKD
ncbi:FeoB-associated Cys-rich membrane protein [Helicovermis profundi]|uniref:FeoB-associated Cys-rich membrane protein n=1 Tax=Helicovermis profundi TaxID=3065157 RepID=A0AAU9ENJ7_9FIRM|nr:hypothetical protein HLPR_03610 [Clostridia bacterium S502]